MQAILIILTSVVAAVLYGIVHDQVTARICVEYFTIGHPPVFGTDDPTLLALGWGVLATWWVGAILGVVLAIAARAGRRPAKTACSLVRPIGVLLGVCAVCAAVGGTTGYFLARGGTIWLVGPLAAEVPRERHVAFLADLWAHSASYLAGFVGGITLAVWTWRSRRVVRPDAS